jgi:hypothetical protein
MGPSKTAGAVMPSGRRAAMTVCVSQCAPDGGQACQAIHFLRRERATPKFRLLERVKSIPQTSVKASSFTPRRRPEKNAHAEMCVRKLDIAFGASPDDSSDYSQTRRVVMRDQMRCTDAFLTLVLLLQFRNVRNISGLQRNPIVVLETEVGNLRLEIDVVHAPVTAANFLKHVDGGFYDGGEFHRAVRPDNEVRTDAAIQIVQFRINPARKGEEFAPIRRPVSRGQAA